MCLPTLRPAHLGEGAAVCFCDALNWCSSDASVIIAFGFDGYLKKRVTTLNANAFSQVAQPSQHSKSITLIEWLECYILQAELVTLHGPGAASAGSSPKLNGMTLHEHLEHYNRQAGLVNPIVQMDHGS